MARWLKRKRPARSGAYEVRTTDGGQFKAHWNEGKWWEYGQMFSTGLKVRRQLRVTEWRPLGKTDGEVTK